MEQHEGALAVIARESKGAAWIATERIRQVAVRGYSAKHDAEHDRNELVDAARAYMETATYPDIYIGDGRGDKPAPPHYWPWDDDDFQPKNPLRDLVRAGALIAAEIDRRIAAGETLD